MYAREEKGRPFLFVLLWRTITGFLPTVTLTYQTLLSKIPYVISQILSSSGPGFGATVRLEGCYRGTGPKIEACRLKDNLDNPLTFLIIIGIGVVALLVGNDTIDIARRGSTPFFD